VADTIQRDIITAAAGKDTERYNPYFMNEAFESQDVFESYKNNWKLRSLQIGLDPTGVFGKRVGGFKF
jgi:hypothetical protein